MVASKSITVECPECKEIVTIIFESGKLLYNYADMYVDHLRGDFDLRKFIESFGRSEILKVMGEMV